MRSNGRTLREPRTTEQGSGMNILGMFVRRPEPGFTKTRLAATIGDVAAAELYAAFVKDLLDRNSTVADRFVLAATPNDEATTSWALSQISESADLVFQPAGDLGKRIDWFFQLAASEGADRTILIGSDSPDLPPELIRLAFEKLQEVDLVIGPATDGGYVLIGLRSPHPGLFGGIRWSSSMTLHDTVFAARRLGLSVELLSPWYDIDVIENLGTLQALQQTPTGGAAACPETVVVLRKLWPRISQAMESE